MGMSGLSIILIVVSYFLGAIPFGLIIAKTFYRVDIRTVGSGNPGATNVWRTLGKKPGITTLLLDMLKGVVPVLMAKYFMPEKEITVLLCGACAIVGHNWSVFLKGKGGKGVATSAGVFLALIPKQAAIALLTFAVAFLISGYVSVGSMLAAVGLVIASFLISTPPVFRVVIIAAGVMLIIKHIPNIKRLANGTENKVRFK